MSPTVYIFILLFIDICCLINFKEKLFLVVFLFKGTVYIIENYSYPTVFKGTVYIIENYSYPTVFKGTVYIIKNCSYPTVWHVQFRANLYK